MRSGKRAPALFIQAVGVEDQPSARGGQETINLLRKKYVSIPRTVAAAD